MTETEAKENYVGRAIAAFTRNGADVVLIQKVVGEFSHGFFASVARVTAAKAAPCGLPAHRLGDRAGRSPGSRVVASSGLPSFPVANVDEARRSQLREQPRLRISYRSVFPLASPAHTGEPARRN